MFVFLIFTTIVSLNAISDGQAASVLDLLRMGCSIDDFGGLFPVIHCDNKGLTNVPELPQNTLELHLPNNSLTDFPCLPLPQLDKLVLRNNSITRVPRACLRKMPRLADIDLSHNRIFCLDIFSDVSFKKGRLLRKLDISYNRLTTLSSCDIGVDMTNTSVTSYEVIFDGNPFHCDCRMAWLVVLLKTTERCNTGEICCQCFLEHNTLALRLYKLSTTSMFRCSSPPDLAGGKMSWLDVGICFSNDTWRLHKPCSLSHTCPIQDLTQPPSKAAKESLPPQTTSSLGLSQTKMLRPDMSHEPSNMTGSSHGFDAASTAPMVIPTSGNGFSKNFESEMPRSLTTLSSRPMFSGEAIKTTVAVGLAAVCGVILAVYSVIVARRDVN